MGEPLAAGPLHLRRYLGPCSDILVQAICRAVHHPLTVVRSLQCNCQPNTVSISSRPQSSRRLAAVPPPVVSNGASQRVAPHAMAAQAQSPDRRVACRFFALNLNEEEGVVHCACRRCARLILVYDRTLYWGMRRPRDFELNTFPYKCSCGGHAFEVAVGFEYPEEPLDENDIEMISVAVRCASCEEMAIIFDDEAT